MRWRTAVVLLGWVLAQAGAGRAQSGPAASALAWTAAGPASVQAAGLGGALSAGPVDALAAAPDGTMYAGGPGGVWHFTPVTDQWMAVSSGAPVASLAIMSGVLYAGTGSVVTPGEAGAGTGILVSRDGGAHWSRLGAATFAGLAITRVAVNPGNAANLLAVAVLPPGAASGPSPGLYASNDGGSNWTEVISGTVWDAVWNATGNAVLAAVATSGATALELATTSQGPFVPLTLSRPPSAPVALSDGAGGGFFAFWLGAQPGLAAITGTGAATPLPLPASLGTGETTGLALNSDGVHIWVGAADVWASSDQGQSWTDLSSGRSVATQQHAVALASGGGVWVANDGGVWAASSGGSLQNENAGLNNQTGAALALTTAGAAVAWAGDSDGAGTGTLAATSAWTADGRHALSLLAAGGSVVYGVPRSSAQVLTSSDGGQTWGAANHAPVAMTGTISALTAAADMVAIGTSTGELWVSGDAGVSWQQRTAPVSNGITALAAAPGALWLAAGNALWSSSDAGVSWIAAPDPGGVVSVLAADPAGAGVVAAVTPAGPEWLAAGVWTALSAPVAPVTALAWDGSGTLWAATLGRGFWSLALGQAQMQLAVSTSTPTAVAGQDGAVNITVHATDLAGPAAGVVVTFGGDANWSATATTDASGTAVVAFPVPTTAGVVTVLATATGAWGTATGNTSLQVQPAALSQIQIVAGQNVAAAVNTVLDLTLATEDAYGNAVAGVSVTLSGPGTFSPSTVTTGADGRASVAYTLPATAGTVTLTATGGTVTQTWTQTVLPPPSYSLVLTPPAAAIPPGQGAATVTVQVVPGPGGYTAPVPLQDCQPAPGCSFSAATVSAPYPPVALTVDLAARTADQSSFPVSVTADATHTATASIPLQGFTFATSATALNVTAGQTSAPVTLTLTPVNGMAASVSFQAAAADGSALPAWLVPVFTPGAIAIPAAKTASFVVSAAAAAGATAPSDGWPWGELGMLLAGAGSLGIWRRRRRRGGPRLVLVTVLAVAATACGGGGSSGASPAPPPAAPAPTVSSYTLQLTATAGGLQATVPVQVSVTTP